MSRPHASVHNPEPPGAVTTSKRYLRLPCLPLLADDSVPGVERKLARAFDTPEPGDANFFYHTAVLVARADEDDVAAILRKAIGVPIVVRVRA